MLLIASDVIRPFEPRDTFDLWCRVSTCKQHQRGNNDDQYRRLYDRATEDCCAVVSRTAKHVGNGFEVSQEFLELVRHAKRKGATILAESVDRFIRHPLYHSKYNPDAQASDAQLETLSDLADGVELMVVLHPDSTPAQVRKYQRMRGREAKGNRGGRPKLEPSSRRPFVYDSRYDEASLREAMEYFQMQLSIREIAKEMQRSPSTIQGWIKIGLARCTNFPR